MNGEPDPYLHCKRCGNTWIRRMFDTLPLHCPARNCKSKYWNADYVRDVPAKYLKKRKNTKGE
jgi:hypothetical protein